MNKTENSSALSILNKTVNNSSRDLIDAIENRLDVSAVKLDTSITPTQNNNLPDFDDLSAINTSMITSKSQLVPGLGAFGGNILPQIMQMPLLKNKKPAVERN